MSGNVIQQIAGRTLQVTHGFKTAVFYDMMPCETGKQILFSNQHDVLSQKTTVFVRSSNLKKKLTCNKLSVTTTKIMLVGQSI